jgi:hypothetical protein
MREELPRIVGPKGIRAEPDFSPTGLGEGKGAKVKGPLLIYSWLWII